MFDFSRRLGILALGTMLVSSSVFASEPHYQSVIQPYKITHVEDGFVVERCGRSMPCAKVGELSWRDYQAIRTSLVNGGTATLTLDDMRPSTVGKFSAGAGAGAAGAGAFLVTLAPWVYLMAKMDDIGAWRLPDSGIGMAGTLFAAPALVGIGAGYGAAQLLEKIRAGTVRETRVKELDDLMLRLSTEVPLGSSVSIALPSWVEEATLSAQ